MHSFVAMRLLLRSVGETKLACIARISASDPVHSLALSSADLAA
jgi:hypothetical protein